MVLREVTVAFLLWSAGKVVVESQQERLSLMFITSGGGQYNSSGAEPAINLAVSIINSNDIIPGHELVIETRGNSNCDQQMALTSFVKNVSVGNDKVALIGCGCSIATLAVAEISWLWNITHMSFSSSLEALNDRKKFPNFWRTHPSEGNLADVMLAIMKEYDWTRIKIITQEESLFVDSTKRITDLLISANVTVDNNGTTSFASSSNVTSVGDIYISEVRIYFLNMYSVHARRLLCNAAQVQRRSNDELYVPGYVWITLGWYRDNWWTEVVSQDNLQECTDSVLEQLIIQSIAVQESNSAEDRNAPTDVILTAHEFKDQYSASLGNEYSFEPTAFFAYDAVWALAFAFNKSLEEVSFSNFTYASGKNVTMFVMEELQNTGFRGVSGYVSFNENGTRPQALLQVLTYRKGSTGSTVRILVALENGSKLEYINNESSATVWPDGTPVDGTPTIITVPIILPLAIIYYILATAGIVFAVICLFFNIIFRKRKIVRLISPNLNYVIIVGGILLYSAVYLYTLSTTNPEIFTITCHVRVWVQMIGYFLCFGTIVVKMWRVFYIFHNPSVKRKWVPKDWHLFLMVVCMCAVIVILGIAVALFGNYGAELVEDSEIRSARNATNHIVIKYNNIVCEGPRSIIWIVLLFAYIFATQIVAVILAFRTRKVTIKALNDSKQLTIIIYLSTAIITVMIISAVILSRFLNTDAAVFGGLILFFTTLVLGLMFIPKMVMLYKDPKGENIFDRGETQGTLNNTVIDDCRIQQYQDLEQHCIDLENRLSKYEEVIPFQKFTRSSSIRKYSTSGYTRSTSLTITTGLATIPQDIERDNKTPK